MTWWAVALGALFGAPGRFYLDSAITARWGARQPWGTLAVNLLGSAVLGVLSALAGAGHLSGTAYDLVGVGFCGAFTTFSTFVWETITLAEQGRSRGALVNVGLSLAGGLGAAGAAFALTTAFT